MSVMTETSENIWRWGSSLADFSSSAVVIGLGGNLGDVRSSFRSALCELKKLSSFGRVSSLYRTAPIGPSQPEYLNAAVLLSWPADLFDLLAFTQDLEKRAHRQRSIRWGPRTLDLDVLWAQGRSSSTSSLTVPHSRLLERRFALEPFSELFPDGVEPIPGCSLRRTLATLEGQSVERLSAPPW